MLDVTRSAQVRVTGCGGFPHRAHAQTWSVHSSLTQSTESGVEFVARRYRDRVYGAYVSGRAASLAPATVAGFDLRRHQLCRVIRQHFPRDRASSIFDLGCGHGALLHFARESGYLNVRGIDASSEQVAAAKRLGIVGIEQRGVFDALKGMSDGELDCVIAFDLIEHFTRDELISLVDEVRRVLKGGGRWIIHAPNAESPFGMRVRYGDLTHELAFTRVSIAQLLLSSGFSEVQSYEDYPEPYTPIRLLRWTIWKLIRVGLRLYLAAETGDPSHDAIFSQNLLTVAVK